MTRNREVKKMGGSWFIKLSPSDIEDFQLKEGDLVDIEELIKLKKK